MARSIEKRINRSDEKQCRMHVKSIIIAGLMTDVRYTRKKEEISYTHGA